MDQVLRQSVLNQRKLKQDTQDIAERSRNNEEKPTNRGYAIVQDLARWDLTGSGAPLHVKKG